MNRLRTLPSNTMTEGPAWIVWPLEFSEIYSARSLRKVLTTDRFPGVLHFPKDTIWRAAAPSKIQCFCWMVFFKRIATIDNLQRRGMQLANRCVLCGGDLETVDHLLLHCDFSTKIWAKVSSTLSIFGPRQQEICDVFVSWKGLNCSSQFEEAMQVIPHAIVWFIWKERNDRIFREVEKPYFVIARSILLSVRAWLAAADIFSEEQQRAWDSLVFDPG
ncbi:Putative ribonuclease H protein At1g65750 [Linum perenne]